MLNFHEKHLDYIIFGIFCLVLLILLLRSKDFIIKALSEGDRPSSKRLGGFLLIIVVCFNETFTTLKTQKFDKDHLLFILIAIMLCWGIATMPQILEAWKGVKPPPDAKSDITTVTDTVISAKSVSTTDTKSTLPGGTTTKQGS